MLAKGDDNENIRTYADENDQQLYDLTVWVKTCIAYQY